MGKSEDLVLPIFLLRDKGLSILYNFLIEKSYVPEGPVQINHSPLKLITQLSMLRACRFFVKRGMCPIAGQHR